MHWFSPIAIFTLQYSDHDDLFYQIARYLEITELTNISPRTSLSHFSDLIQSNQVTLSTTNITFSSLDLIASTFLMRYGPLNCISDHDLCSNCNEISFIFKLHHFTFLPTLKSTTESISFASLLNEATKAQTGVLIAEGYIHGRHTAYWNFQLTIPVDVFSVKSFVNSLLNPMCVSVQCHSRSINLNSCQSG